MKIKLPYSILSIFYYQFCYNIVAFLQLIYNTVYLISYISADLKSMSDFAVKLYTAEFRIFSKSARIYVAF